MVCVRTIDKEKGNKSGKFCIKRKYCLSGIPADYSWMVSEKAGDPVSGILLEGIDTCVLLGTAGISKKWQGMALSVFMKVVFAPVVCTLFAIPLHFSMEELTTIYVLHAVPSAVNSYIMTAKMGGDEETGAGIVMLSSLSSVVTMTAGIYLLKQMHLI